MADDLTHFRVSAGLKNIIGNELITDDFVAVFELVKNAYDAHASRVIVRFENVGKPKDASLTIEDNGKGMTRKDLYEKWLFVAYSAKKHETEDSNLRESDYRNLIGIDRPFAGAKGIGRFSCDRLGRYLTIYTRRDPDCAQFETLRVDWKNFESDDQRRFEDIDIEHGQVKTGDVPGAVGRGTVLKITGLRSQWTYQRLQDLRDELQKLITPEVSAEEKKIGNQAFQIVVEAPEFSEKDRRQTDPGQRVNGPVQNFLFERLKIKTTELTCRFSESGKTIETRLVDKGQLIYDIVEGNAEWPALANLTFRLFYLNRAAKLAFKRTVGVEPVKYGSVFLYKNGLRVQPYGKAGDDGFAIDRRKQQGVRRYLGTRDLAGRIELTVNPGDKSLFKEASSRNDGLIESPEKLELFDCFREVVLRRLENYVVDVMRWGNPPKGEDADAAPAPTEARNEILELVKRLTDSKNIARFEADPHILSIVNERQANSAQAILDNFERIATAHGDESLRKEARRLRREMNSVFHDRGEIQAEVVRERRKRVLTEKQLDAERQRNRFLTDLARPADKQRSILEHWVKLVGENIRARATTLLGAAQSDNCPKDKLISGLFSILQESQKLVAVSDLVTHAGFALKQQRIQGDLARYFFEYLNSATISSSRIRHEIVYDSTVRITTQFRPVEVSILVDNLISNAKKAGATRMRWEISVSRSRLRIMVSNDGRPLSDFVKDSLFKLGASGTGGSGIGLFTCRELARGMGGEIRFTGNDSAMGGASFELDFPL
jgi:signal transduction histidine kinase